MISVVGALYCTHISKSDLSGDNDALTRWQRNKSGFRLNPTEITEPLASVVSNL